jgi:hypothetical protein
MLCVLFRVMANENTAIISTGWPEFADLISIQISWLSSVGGGGGVFLATTSVPERYNLNFKK